MPSQNSGIAYSVSVDRRSTIRSKVLPRFQPPRMPIQTPMTVDRIVEMPTSSSVGQIRSPMTVPTGWEYLIDRPRSPWRKSRSR